MLKYKMLVLIGVMLLISCDDNLEAIKQDAQCCDLLTNTFCLLQDKATILNKIPGVEIQSYSLVLQGSDFDILISVSDSFSFSKPHDFIKSISPTNALYKATDAEDEYLIKLNDGTQPNMFVFSSFEKDALMSEDIEYFLSAIVLRGQNKFEQLEICPVLLK